MNMVKSIKLVLQCLRDRCMLNPQATFLYAPHAEQGFFCFTKKAIDKMGINMDTGMYLEKQANYSRTQVLRKENPSTSIDSMQARCCCANNFHSADSADGNLPNRIPTSTCTRPDVHTFTPTVLLQLMHMRATSPQCKAYRHPGPCFCGTEEL
jgi:hypothetical protein